MCTAGAPRPQHSWDVGRGRAGAVRSRWGTRRALRSRWVRPSVRARRGHGRAPRAPLCAGARAVVRLGGAGRRGPEAGRGVPEPLPVLPQHRALHASAAGGRARCGAADLHPVSPRGAEGPGEKGESGGAGRLGSGAQGRSWTGGTFGGFGRRGAGRGPAGLCPPWSGRGGRPPEPPLFGARNLPLDREVVGGSRGKPRSAGAPPSRSLPPRPPFSRSGPSAPKRGAPLLLLRVSPFSFLPLPLPGSPSCPFSRCRNPSGDPRPRSPPCPCIHPRRPEPPAPGVLAPRGARPSGSPCARSAPRGWPLASPGQPGSEGLRAGRVLPRVLPLVSSRDGPRSRVSRTSPILGAPVGTKYCAWALPAPQRPNAGPWPGVPRAPGCRRSSLGP